jgi:hypothetical protein
MTFKKMLTNQKYKSKIPFTLFNILFIIIINAKNLNKSVSKSNNKEIIIWQHQ